MTPLPTPARTILITAAAAVLPLLVVAPAHADSTVNPHKLQVFDKHPRGSHVSARDESRRQAGLNHNKHLRSVKTVFHRPPGGTNGGFRAYAETYVKVPFIETSATYVDNVARVAWLGFKPYNADQVQMTQAWSTHGLRVSFTGGISKSGGSLDATVNGASADVKQQFTRTKDWHITSYVDSLRFSGMDVMKVRHGVAGAFNFKSATFAVSTTDAALV